ncbi:MAG TPA: hypothetical protein VEK08_12615 [Planctomycetota bacterium]|nr:hypothetical protein [Planctomycetota bacterium]
MADEMDNLLRELGQGTPFAVDWSAYERDLMQRIFLQQAQRRRRMWWATLSGAAAGAVATFVLTLSFGARSQLPHTPTNGQASTAQDVRPPAPPVEIAPEIAPAPQPSLEPVNGPLPVPGPGEVVRIIRRENGSLARVRVDAAEFKQEAIPFSRKSRRSDGRTSEITFVGFSGPDAGSPAAMGALSRKP